METLCQETFGLRTDGMGRPFSGPEFGPKMLQKTLDIRRGKSIY